MDKRTVAALVSALAVYYLWMTWVSANPSPPAPIPEAPPVAAPSQVSAPQGAPAVATDTPAHGTTYKVCALEGELWSAGGGWRALTLHEHLGHYEVQPLWSWAVGKVTGESGPWLPYGPTPDPVRIVSDQGHFLEMGVGPLGDAAPSVSVQVQGDVARLSGFTPQGIEVTRTLRPVQVGGHCVVEVSATWRNTGAMPFRGDLWVSTHDVLPLKSERYNPAARPVMLYDGEFEEFTKIEKLVEPEPREGKVSWLGLANGYFAAVLLPSEASNGRGTFVPRTIDGAVAHGASYAVAADLAPGAAHTEVFQLYAGPKSMTGLSEIREDLSELVRLGFFGFFAKLLLIALTFFHGLLGNWGWAIIALTVVVKAIFYPLTQMSFKSSQAMQDVQPQLAKIREQYQDKPEELNRRTMELFKENGVNPFGGCLPMLVQMPVWFALYSALLSSVDLYHTEFYFLKDLSVADPYMVLPITVVTLMMVQQQFVPTGNMDPMQAKMMKYMPIVFGFFFFAFPSGLVLYIFVNTLLTILQQWLIKRQFGKRNELAVSRA